MKIIISIHFQIITAKVRNMVMNNYIQWNNTIHRIPSDTVFGVFWLFLFIHSAFFLAYIYHVLYDKFCTLFMVLEESEKKNMAVLTIKCCARL